MKRIQITLGLLLVLTTATPLRAQVSAFTYQGRLNLNGAPADGIYDLRFTIYDALTGGGAAGGPLTDAAVAVNNGLFSVLLDFGAGVFNGEPRWLEINVRTNGGGAFTTLSPRQLLTPAPYAIAAQTASNLLGALPAGQISGTILNASLPASPTFSGTVTANNFSGNGAGLTDVNAATLGGLSRSNLWGVAGNTGTSAGTHFLGTTDNQPLELKANSRRALRLEASGFGAPNFIGGSEVNVVDGSVVGATIAGGGAANYAGFVSSNRVSGDFGTIGGGGLNSTVGFAATVGGGWNNTCGGGATVSGGQGNIANNGFATVSGGERNISDNHHATVGGGGINTSSGEYATVGGGYWNTSSGVGATIGGGELNKADGFGASIGGGRDNTNSAVYGTIAGGLYNCAGSNYVTVVGGIGNSGNGESAVISGGERNISSNAWATVAGGYQNVAGGQLSFAAGRRAFALYDGVFVWADAIPGSDSFGDPFISTGAHQFLIRATGGMGINTNSPVSALHVNGGVTANNFSGNGSDLTDVDAATLGGLNSSNFWRTTGNAGTTVGTHFLGTTDNQPLELRAGNIRAFRIEKDSSGFGAPNVIGGAPVNLVEGGVFGATISGGGVAFFGVPRANRVGGNFGAISGGSGNTILAQSATIGGGDGNTIETNAFSAIIGGGAQNSIAGGAGTIAGGRHNFTGLGADFAAIGGGFQNWIKNQATADTIAGGYANTIQDGAAGCIIGGGSFNTIGADSTQATITGGYLNEGGTNSIYSAIGGGWHNTIGANSSHGTVAGGAGNSVGVNAASSAIAGGWENRTGNLSEGSALGGGKYNLTASNSICATIPGGENNFATNYAFAVGRSAKANHTGTLVWGDSTDADITSTNDNSVTMRASGGYRLFTDANATTGAFLEAGSGSWTSMSDRNAKENFRAADAREVLEKVVALPVQTWNYKSQDARIRHIGPMAQDFQAAFGVGESDTGIATVDADGVALAAIQGLNQKLEETRAENAELKQHLAELEQAVQKLGGGP